MSLRESFNQLPALTPAGRVAELLGFLAFMTGFYLDHRGLLVLGLVFLVPVAYAWIAVWIQSSSMSVTVRRPRLARALDPSPVHVTGACGVRVPSVIVHDVARPRLGALVHLRALRPREPRRVRGLETWTRRGQARPGPLTLHCSRPLGLACRDRQLAAGEPLVVLPALGRVAGRLRDLLFSGQRDSAVDVRRRGFGGDLRNLRPFLPGDSHRHIHWPTTARVGEIMVREWDDQEDDALLILGLGWRSAGSPLERSRVEGAISLVATLMHTSQRPLLLLLPGEEDHRVLAGDRRALQTAECALAQMGADPGWPRFEDVAVGERIAARLLIHTGTCSLPTLPDEVRALSVGDALSSGEFLPRGGVLA